MYDTASRYLKKYHHYTLKISVFSHRGVEMKAVRCIETGVEYPSAIAASEATGINQASIAHACDGRQCIAGRFHWEFVDKTYRSKWVEKWRRLWRRKKIRNIDTGTVYSSVTEASVATGSGVDEITQLCGGIYPKMGSKTAVGVCR